MEDKNKQIDEHVVETILLEQIDNQIKEVKTKGDFGRSDCLVTDCAVQNKLELIKKQLKEKQEYIVSLQRQLELTEQKLIGDLKDDEIMKVLDDVKKSKEVNRLEGIIKDLNTKISQLAKKIDAEQTEFMEYKERNEKILTRFEADKQIQKLIKDIDYLERKRKLFLIDEEKFQKRKLQYEQFLQDLDAGIEAKQQEYASILKKLEEARKLKKKGIDIKSNKGKLNNDIGFIKRIFLLLWSPQKLREQN